MVQQAHRLQRSRDNRFLFGVAGGLGEYFEVDPVLVRMGWILLTMATVGLAVLFYIGLAMITPNDGRQVSKAKPVNDASGDSSGSIVEAELGDGPSKRRVARNVLGVGLIVVGMITLLQQLDLFDSMRWDIVWPAAIMLVGMTILLPTMTKLNGRLPLSRAKSGDDGSGDASDSVVESDVDEGSSKRHLARTVFGVGMVVVGMITLLQQLGVFGSIRWDIVWPVAIVLLGMTILLPSITGSRS